MNSVQLVGRLTRDPEVKYTSGDKQIAVARFTVACNRKYKKEGEQEADFISITPTSGNCELIPRRAKFI